VIRSALSEPVPPGGRIALVFDLRQLDVPEGIKGLGALRLALVELIISASSADFAIEALGADPAPRRHPVLVPNLLLTRLAAMQFNADGLRMLILRATVVDPSVCMRLVARNEGAAPARLLAAVRFELRAGGLAS
jgi:hypothetical protein